MINNFRILSTGKYIPQILMLLSMLKIILFQLQNLKTKFDLLISQYAGFISDTCINYLKVNGYLLVNNSHADAGLAAIDKDYKLL